MLRFLLIISLSLLFACSSSKYSKNNYGIEKSPDIYTVKKGDTLFSISWRFGLEQRAVMRKNHIANPNKIYIGQKLRLKNYGTRTYSSSNKKATSSQQIVKRGNWVWPVNGRIIRHFSAGRIGANGIRIAAKVNQTVNAAEGGTVVYKGNGLNGYGNVIIIKHRNNLLSAYGFLSKTYVRKGQKVKKRQKIGRVGYAANKQLMLHFEVRSKGSPVNPLSYIGRKYHF